MIPIPSIGFEKKTSGKISHPGALLFRLLLRHPTSALILSLFTITTGCARYRPTLLISYSQEGKGLFVERIAEGSSPSWSPDGKKIAFQREGIWILDLESRDQNRISPVGSHPAWSPDGKSIAYVHHGIWLLDTNTGTSQHLNPFGNHPKWFPDGKALVFQHQGIWRILPDGSNKRKMLDQGVPLSFSPDGSSLLIELWDPERVQFFLALLNILTGQINQLVDGTKGSFAPDGYSVVYSLNGIWIYSFIKNDATVILLDGYYPKWSPVGDKIIFTAQGIIWLMDAPYKTINQG